jgi:hypothetical protein
MGRNSTIGENPGGRAFDLVAILDQRINFAVRPGQLFVSIFELEKIEFPGNVIEADIPFAEAPVDIEELQLGFTSKHSTVVTATEAPQVIAPPGVAEAVPEMLFQFVMCL